jgi:Protein of unknown function (DUF2924)
LAENYLRDRDTHQVLVGEDGFVWQREHYRSLSQIARAIIGTRWSGPVFFGLKIRPEARPEGVIDAAG